MMTDERRRLEKLVNRLEPGQYVNGIAVETMRELFAELHRLEHALEKLRKECERLDADGDKWMNRAAVAEQRLDDLQK